ncbi:MAG: LuxR C-terminal-related transcriptional regulator [Henriciella sp.]|nr:LuxR C-terminal-related transcriptional regulator [Henriciella sp.]
MNEEIRQFEIMTGAIKSISGQVDAPSVFRELKHFLRDFTFGAEHAAHDRGMLGVMQLVDEASTNGHRIAVSNWSEEYWGVRRSLNHFSHDPTILKAQQTSAPFTWASALKHADKASIKVAELCAEYTGQSDGLLLPIGDIRMVRGCASIGLDMDPSEFSPTQIAMIHHVCTAAYARIHKLLGPFPFDQEVYYSPREREVVRAMALGYSTLQTAELLGLSQATVKDYIASAKRKVGARTAPELIAKSITKNVILT